MARMELEPINLTLGPQSFSEIDTPEGRDQWFLSLKRIFLTLKVTWLPFYHNCMFLVNIFAIPTRCACKH